MPTPEKTPGESPVHFRQAVTSFGPKTLCGKGEGFFTKTATDKACVTCAACAKALEREASCEHDFSGQPEMFLAKTEPLKSCNNSCLGTHTRVDGQRVEVCKKCGDVRAMLPEPTAEKPPDKPAERRKLSLTDAKEMWVAHLGVKPSVTPLLCLSFNGIGAMRLIAEINALDVAKTDCPVCRDWLKANRPDLLGAPPARKDEPVPGGGSQFTYCEVPEKPAFKVGDRVRVCAEPPKKKSQGKTSWYGTADEFCGKIGTIDAIEEECARVNVEGLPPWWFHESWLTAAESGTGVTLSGGGTGGMAWVASGTS